MQLVPELDDLVTELCRAHPRFPRVTVERLVARTAAALGESSPDELVPAVRLAAEAQLRYIDEQPPTVGGPHLGRQRGPAEL